MKICLTALLPLVLLGHKLSGIHAQLLSQVQIFVTPWTVAHQTSLSMGFPRQECWSGWLFPPAGDLPHLEVKPMAPALAGGFFATELPGKPKFSSIQKLMGMGLLMWEWGNVEKKAGTKQVNSLTWFEASRLRNLSFHSTHLSCRMDYRPHWLIPSASGFVSFCAWDLWPLYPQGQWQSIKNLRLWMNGQKNERLILGIGNL